MLIRLIEPHEGRQDVTEYRWVLSLLSQRKIQEFAQIERHGRFYVVEKHGAIRHKNVEIA